MKTLLLLLISFLYFENFIFCQTNDTCSIWKGYTKSVNKKFDTIHIHAKYLGLLENEYHQYSKNDKSNLFYQNLENHFNGLPLSLEFEMVDCEKGYYYPFAYKPKYAYTLFHRKNKLGIYEDWQKGQLIELTIVRYNNYFDDGKNLITIVTDINPLKGVLPVKEKVFDSTFINSLKNHQQ